HKLGEFAPTRLFRGHTGNKAVDKKAPAPAPAAPAAAPAKGGRERMAEARAFQRSTRQSPNKMRLGIDHIRGPHVNDAPALLQFSKKQASRQIAKVLRSAVANAEQRAREANESLDVDTLFVKKAIINEGPKLKRWTPAAMGRATPVLKRT